MDQKRFDAPLANIFETSSYISNLNPLGKLIERYFSK